MVHAAQTNIANNTKGFNTVIVFRTQQLMDLWVNEMQGQISDGMWENCRNTDWLWRREAHILGDKTEVLVNVTWGIGRKNYPLTKQLWENIGDRILEDNGFADKKEATKAWKEILEAIRNARLMTEDERKIYVYDCLDRGKAIVDNLKAEAKATLEKIKEHFGEENVDCYGSMLSIKHQILNRNIWINPVFYTTLNKLTYQVYVDSAQGLEVDTYEKILKAVELHKDFYNKREELMKE